MKRNKNGQDTIRGDCEFNIQLTALEEAILRRLCDGQSTHKVAEDLGINTENVKSAQENIMRILDADHIADIVRYAIERKLID